MSVIIDYFYSLASPFTYLGGPRLTEIARKHQATIVHKPIKMVDVLAAAGGVPLAKRSQQRQAYRLQELTRIPRKLGMPLTLHPAYFPVDDSLAAHLVLAAQAAEGPGSQIDDLSHAFLRAVWAEDRNIADPDTCRTILSDNDFDADALMAAAPAEAEARGETTDEAIDRGVFGAPTYMIGEQMFWGQDRLDYLEDAVLNARKHLS